MMMCFFQASVGANGAAPAAFGHAELLTKVAQTTDTIAGCVVNLTFGDALADADIHGKVSCQYPEGGTKGGGA